MIENVITVKWYHVEREYDHVIDLHVVNHATGAELWKTYTGKTRQEAERKAKSFCTMVQNRAARIYG